MIKQETNTICKTVMFKGCRDSDTNSTSTHKSTRYTLNTPARWAGCLLVVLTIAGLSGGTYAHTESEVSTEPHAHTALHLNSGDKNFEQGNMKEAMVSYKAAFDVANRVSKDDQGDAVWQRELSVSLAAMGDIQVVQKDLAGAMANYNEALVIRKKLLKSDPENISYLLELSVLHKKIGNVLVHQSNVFDALMSYRASLMSAKRLSVGKADHDELWLMSLAWRNWRMAQRGSDQGDRWGEVLRLLDMLKEETGSTAQDVKAYQTANGKFAEFGALTK